MFILGVTGRGQAPSWLVEAETCVDCKAQFGQAGDLGVRDSDVSASRGTASSRNCEEAAYMA